VNLTLGINNCFAVKRWPLADEWTQIVREELGLGVIQHSLDLSDLGQDPEAEANAISVACAASGVEIHSVFTGLRAYSAGLMLAPAGSERDRGFDFWSRAIRFASRLGARSIGGHVGSLSRRDADDSRRRERRWDELQRNLARLSELARRCGVDALLVENMACDREPCRMSELSSLVRAADSGHAAVALCLDVGHQCVPGSSGDEADPYAWLRRMGRQAMVVHLQQTDATADHHWPFTAGHNHRGRIRARDVLDALAASGAQDVALVLEIIPSFEADDAGVLADLRESVFYWQDALRDHDGA
jgi:sugar phosphate isomerase/epimerase